MPTTYAHYKFGEELKKNASFKVAASIKKYPELFQIGLHGPDILFYYKIFCKNDINEIGTKMHTLPGKDFFEKAAVLIRKKGFDEAYLSYTLGFLCHFILDVTCHGFVNQKVKEEIADHLTIEAELDRELLLRDGRNPETAILTGHLKAKEENAKVICDFYEGVTAEKIKTSMKDMIFLLDLLVPKNNLKRNLLNISLKAVGKYREYQGLIISRNGRKECEEAVLHLLELFEEAKRRIFRLSEEYIEYLYERKELDVLYDWNFDSILKEG